MKWISQDIDKFLQSKEYVDTAVIPLLPVSLGNDMKQSASMSEFISLLSVQLERQFRGRVMMLPGYSYLKSASADKLSGDIKFWENELFANGFKHVFHVTSDSSWKSMEDQLDGSLIWLPSIPLEHMDERNRNTILEDQVKQLLNLFMQKWQNAE
ncbi:YpiF family protein [Bacillus sp. DTU_2020_1000418_1_SI_GHA_SEK_038]|uniref:YpiF family protein n=1 Tax=Bacillus sp. DTU_2020_1000418_1_SI_GHA_SEK_038 TaxID=3077585 RepID=UPI0028E67628|nr:YpiF family protein [Bacillus sp. DTU_2020_1000418_1_SI_GHA_SEK_038]WNS74021.1 YpiF family protein [Bacillus sp. DTU_2020_1000418_1_SI_GHA_SEK_038]